MWLKLYLHEMCSRSLWSVKLERVIFPRALSILFLHKETQKITKSWLLLVPILNSHLLIFTIETLIYSKVSFHKCISLLFIYKIYSQYESLN